ncbi:fatty acyl-AMP ligase [Actinocrinis sp.]|uniref:fatty acyl-AMP ligase n=1 Tax=Actinocrinis sp. TaxID=1920516 RepID=UPI002D3BF0C7|nr:fatty acyl-AMP ligase [Actinocrinis sp.]HZP50206.1 fatty acyl-AMP ligase [Actinocrinis sp.]
MPSDSALSSDPANTDRLLVERLRRLAAERAHQRAFTFVDYPEPDSPGRHRTLTWSQLLARAEAVAIQLADVVRPGDRAALLLPQGLDYVAAFLGCLMARVVAVPLFPPDLPGHEDRIAAVLDDCEPACALVTAESARATQGSAAAVLSAGLPLVRVDDAARVSGTAAVWPGTTEPDPEDVAYLQYTSGSTRTPAGVMITHRNVVANALQGVAAFDIGNGPTTAVAWLPLFHDMGLVLSIATPLVAGFPSVLMDPVAFLERPERWLRLLGQFPGALSAAPNFAYEYCVARVAAEQLGEVRLDRVRALVNGSEPVRIETLRRFRQAFAGVGLRAQALCPSYGLAEATVFVTTDGPQAAPRELVCRRDALADGLIAAATDRPVAAGDGFDQPAFDQHTDARDDVVSLVACGLPASQELLIIDPVTKLPLPQEAVGEIVLRGPNIGVGYWRRPQQSAETFGLVLPGTGDRPWLRTGDLGALHDGRLLVTGRLKDLLIVDGRNHYPQDIEESIQSALSSVRKGRVAVFGVPQDDRELIVAVAEHRRDLMPDEALREEADRAARARVSIAHGLRLDQLVLVPPGSVPRTSSGKVSRSACRLAFLRGEYDGCLARQPERV